MEGIFWSLLELKLDAWDPLHSSFVRCCWVFISTFSCPEYQYIVALMRAKFILPSRKTKNINVSSWKLQHQARTWYVCSVLGDDSKNVLWSVLRWTVLTRSSSWCEWQTAFVCDLFGLFDVENKYSNNLPILFHSFGGFSLISVIIRICWDFCKICQDSMFGFHIRSQFACKDPDCHFSRCLAS